MRTTTPKRQRRYAAKPEAQALAREADERKRERARQMNAARVRRFRERLRETVDVEPA
jgi:hypothetical protein